MNIGDSKESLNPAQIDAEDHHERTTIVRSLEIDGHD
jgi:hypothetical protein